MLGGHLLGWRTICAVERDAYAAGVLAQRQNDGCLPPFPIWSDVTTFDGKPWRGRVDVISGGFPCQDISAAGRGEGISGARSGLWSEFARIIGEVRPRYVFVENSPVLTSRGLGLVLGDLAALGFDARWGVLGAADVGAPHQRDRIWIVAHTQCAEWRQEPGACNGMERERTDCLPQRQEGSGGPGVGGEAVAYTPGQQSHGSRSRPEQERRHEPANSSEAVADSSGVNAQGQQPCITDEEIWQVPGERPAGSRINGFGWWLTEPSVGRVVNGLANRVDRLKALGNGQVPRVAAAAFTELAGRE
nr:DNA cytosine methyltransferase [Marinobacter salarius]